MSALRSSSAQTNHGSSLDQAAFVTTNAQSATALLATASPLSKHTPHLQYLSISAETLLLDLKPVQRMIFAFVISLEKAGKRCFASNTYLAKICNVSYATAQRHVTFLIKCGLLRTMLTHTSGTQRLLSVSTPHLEAAVAKCLHPTLAHLQHGTPLSTLFPADTVPLSPLSAASFTAEEIAAINLEAERAAEECTEEINYCMDIHQTVQEMVAHLEAVQLQHLQDAQRRRVEATAHVEASAQTVLPFDTALRQAQGEIRFNPHAELVEALATEPLMREPFMNEPSPLSVQSVGIIADDAPALSLASPQFEYPPYQNEEPPPQIEDPYIQSYSISLYEKKSEPSEIFSTEVLHEESSENTFSNDDGGENTLPVNENKKTAGAQAETVVQRDPVEQAIIMLTERQQQRANAQFAALQTKHEILHQAQERLRSNQSSARQTITTAKAPTVPKASAQNSVSAQKTFYQQQGQKRSDERDGITTFHELPLGALFVWEGSSDVYGAFRKVSPTEILRLDNRKTIVVQSPNTRVQRRG